MLPCEPIAKKNSGVRSMRPTTYNMPICTPIQITPSRNSHGRSISDSRSICMPMQAIRKYRNNVPIFEAPAASRLRARVKLNTRPIRVDSITTHTKDEFNEALLAQLTLSPNHPANGVANACARPTTPRPTPTMTIKSVRLGLRELLASYSAMRRFMSSMAEVSAPLLASMACERPANHSSTAIHRLAQATSTTANWPKVVASTLKVSRMAAMLAPPPIQLPANAAMPAQVSPATVSG
ncbi:hypothetical protein D3C71_1110290 [compost metagenome]